MPALSLTAVDHTTGQLTIPAHGLVTGGGFVGAPTGPASAAIFAAPGSGGVVPTGLVATTSYWPIVVDANTIRLATSNANAIAGTFVAFTDNGALPLQYLVGLPYRVPRIAAPLTQINHDDDNATWGSLVALWNLLTGQAQSIYSGVALAVPLSVGGLLTANAGLTVAGNLKLLADAPRWISASAFQADQRNSVTAFTAGASGGTGPSWTFLNDGSHAPPGVTHSLHYVPPGKTLKSVVFWFNKNAQPLAMTFKVIKFPEGGGPGVALATASDVSSGSALINTTLTPNYTVEPGFFLELNVVQTFNATGSATAFFGAHIVMADAP